MKVADSLRCRNAVLASLVFVAWTITSFLCHECGTLFLQLSEKNWATSNDATKEFNPFQRFILAYVLTTFQCAACLLLVQPVMETKIGIRSRGMFMLCSSHALATLATNYSLAFIEAASTLTIKLTEPITMAIGHHLVFQTAVKLQTVVSIPFIIGGSLIFTDQRAYQMSNTTGVSLAFASNIIFAARNLTIKKLQQGSSTSATIGLQSNVRIIYTILVVVAFLTGLFALEGLGKVPQSCTLLAGLCISSGIFHVAYSYISTSIVLKVMNVVSHSIANIFKRFLVVLLLILAGNRQFSSSNFLGLAIAAFGLLVYTYGKTQSEVLPNDQDDTKETRTTEPLRRKVYITLVFLACISIVTVFSTRQSSLPGLTIPQHDEGVASFYKESKGLYVLEIPSNDFSNITKGEQNSDMREFLSWRLIDHPEDTDRRSKTLTKSRDVIEEAQRILVNLLQDLLGQAKHVMLIEIATYSNKGDPAIAMGEVLLLRRLNISIVYYCETRKCKSASNLEKALQINKKYPKDEMVILMQGGGNLIGYPSIDHIRKVYIDNFPDRRIIMFSQSIWLHKGNVKELKYWCQAYSNHSNLFMFMRDRQSLEIAKTNFKGITIILAPDMAFCIGMVPRQMPPIFDIIWLKRVDGESSNYILPKFPPDISVQVADWTKWISNKGQTDMENSFLTGAGGFHFLERGRIVITDRLHGHILSTLMDIPHVLVDNPPHLKLSSFDRSWTRSLRKTICVSNGSLAMDAAMELLDRYKSSLPLVGARDMYVVKTGEGVQG